MKTFALFLSLVILAAAQPCSARDAVVKGRDIYMVADTISNMQYLSAFCSDVLDIDAASMNARTTALAQQGEDAGFRPGALEAIVEGFRDTRLLDRKLLPRVGSCIQKELLVRRDGERTGVTGPSFDCPGASTPARTLLCRNPELWAFDRALAWVEKTDAGPRVDCTTTDCLRDDYVSRLQVTLDGGFEVKRAAGRRRGTPLDGALR
ncbi:hypothetical protein LAZ40_04820 [Cereibacter sphaeroides]|uniref:hypothetical protein n=1 Tax=Cereibacter sphaeroides TaxID=1063 RepID=UPI001F3854FF|nr:hypothetical protein [Cereibacter sphaeroides]MCE6958379.1 hypothetical protein [Cereibacter sphaeroides]MCE6972246.1 hypothetical protein [Cereibacter sphaeroides]